MGRCAVHPPNRKRCQISLFDPDGNGQSHADRGRAVRPEELQGRHERGVSPHRGFPDGEVSRLQARHGGEHSQPFAGFPID